MGRRPPRSAPASAVPLALVGPTAVGKTRLAIELAKRGNAEIVVVDSMTVYRGMDVGTAKPGPEEQAAVRHHLLDVVEATEPFSVARFQSLAREALADIASRGRRALLVGGSGLYFRAVVDELSFPGTDARVRGLLQAESLALGAGGMHARLAALDPVAAGKIEPGNVRRTVRALEVAALTGRPFSSFAAPWEEYRRDRVRAAGIRLPAETMHARIEERVRAMLAGGLVEEVRRLLERGAGPFLTSSQAIGYLEVVQHVKGRISLEEAAARTVRRTRALARRQMAWFKRDPRIRWFDAASPRLADDLEEHYRG